MASYIWLQTADGSLQQVEQEICKCCPLILDEMKSGVGTSKNRPISLPSRVTPALLSLIFDYCRFHKEPGHSAKELKSFDEKFIRIETQRLVDVAAAANSLKLRPLVDITSRALARMIEGKSTEEIRETFNFPDDLTEEEKLQPLDNTIDDPRIRRLNILYARKRKELQEKEKLKNAEVEEEYADARSVDDLLSFINGGDGDSKGVQSSKSKKKNCKRKDQQKNLPSSCKSSADRTSSSKNAIKIHNKVSNHSDGACHSFKGRGDSLSSRLETIKLSDIGDDELDDLDDDIDPVMKAQIDRSA